MPDAPDRRIRWAADYVTDGGSSAWVLVWPVGGSRSEGTLIRLTWIFLVERVVRNPKPPAAWIVARLGAEGASIPAQPSRALEMVARRTLRAEWGRKPR